MSAEVFRSGRMSNSGSPFRTPSIVRSFSRRQTTSSIVSAFASCNFRKMDMGHGCDAQRNHQSGGMTHLARIFKRPIHVCERGSVIAKSHRARAR